MSVLASLISAALVNKPSTETNLIRVSMTSLEIAATTGKTHHNVMRDIRVMLANVGESENSNLISQYQGARRMERMYVLPEDLANNLVLGYSDEHRLAVVRELQKKHDALVRIRDEADTIEEAKDIAANALSLQREGLRKQQPSFNEVIAKAHDEGTFRAPSVGLAIANANKIPSIVVLGNQPSTIEKKTGHRPRDLFVITEDAVGLADYTEAVGQVKLLASMGFDAKAIRAMVENLRKA